MFEPIFTIWKRSCGKVMLSQVCPPCGQNRQTPPWADAPQADTSWADTPTQTPSWADTPPCRQLLQRTVTILLECILVMDFFGT